MLNSTNARSIIKVIATLGLALAIIAIALWPVRVVAEETTPAVIASVLAATGTDLTGTCSSNDWTNRTNLINAIENANADAKVDTIILAAGCVYTLTSPYQVDDDWTSSFPYDADGYGNNALPPISTTIIISGNGATLLRSGSTRMRLFYITDAGNLTLDNMTLSDGYVQGGHGAEATWGGRGGGAAGMGGAIFNKGSLTIKRSTLDGNRAVGGTCCVDNGLHGGGGGGGGLGGDGSGNNQSPPRIGGGLNGGDRNGGDGGEGGGGGGNGSGKGGDGGFGGGGGGGSSGNNNVGGDGGFGGGVGGGGNGTGGNGGFGGGVSGGAKNSGGGAGMGGAIFNYAGNIAIINSTFYDNIAQGGSNNQVHRAGSSYGGAIFNYTGAVVITNTTFANNTVQNVNSNSSQDGGAIFNYGSGGNLTMHNVILADTPSDATDCYNHSGLVSGSNNLIETDASGGNACGTATFTSDPLLFDLADYGGDTHTVALLPGSQAVNGGDAGACPGSDQRGKPQFGNCDIGSFESQGVNFISSGGSGQIIGVNLPANNPLTVTLKANNPVEPIIGQTVNWTGPGSGADIASASRTDTVDADGNGSTAIAANGTTGVYQVTASSSGVQNTVTYTLTNVSAFNVGITQHVNNTEIFAGRAVTYTISFSNNTASTMTGVVITDMIPSEVVSTTYQASGDVGVTISHVPNTTYQWTVSDLASGQGGVIIVSGYLSSSAQAGSFITNTVEIAADGDLYAADDQAHATVLVSPYETVQIQGVNSNWRKVTTSGTYGNPVVVCTIQYQNNDVPEVVRVQNASSNHFQVRLQNPGDQVDPLLTENVHCIVMEAGQWTLSDGRLVEAQTYLSTVTDENGSWGAETQSYLHDYTTPVVLGQVQTYSDTQWSVFWSRRSNNKNNPPNSDSILTGKHVAEDHVVSRANETVGFIVVEAGHGTSYVHGAYEAAVGGDSIRAIDNTPPFDYTFAQSFATTPQIGIANRMGLDDNNGSWAYLYGATPLQTDKIQLSLDEDQIRDSERSSSTEQVGYWVFEQVTTVLEPLSDPTVSILLLGEDAVPPGEIVTYTITFNNNGGIVAPNVVISDVMPSALTPITYEVALDAGVTLTPTAGVSYVWQAGDLAPNQGGSITITAQAALTISDETLVDNTVTIISTNDQGDIRDDSATASLAIVPTTMVETIVVNGVSDAWGTVPLNNTYDSPVIVCSINYQNHDRPEVVRIRNVDRTHFEMRLQNPLDKHSLDNNETVHCLVVEAGRWFLDKGRKLEAVTYNSTTTDHDGNLNQAQVQSYLHSYTNDPVVLGQVMSFNDAEWSVFWSRATANRSTPPTNTTLQVGKHVGEDDNTSRENETVGYIVIEAGNGTIGGVAYEAAVGPDTVQGIGNSPPYTYTFNQAFSTVPAVGIVTQMAMDDDDGSWAYLYGASPISKDTLRLSVDEDQRNSDRAHDPEQVGYWVFEQATSVITLTNLRITKGVNGSLYTPNESITYTLHFSNNNFGSFSGVVITDIVPEYVDVNDISSSGVTLVDSGASPGYVWQAQTMNPGDSGTITITGRIDPAISQVTEVVNTALIYSPLAETQLDDNQDTVTITVIPTTTIETLIIHGVISDWVTVDLSHSYDEPVVVCTINYQNNGRPAVVRLRNVVGSTFDLRLQNPGDQYSLSEEIVHCLAMEAGQWFLPDKRKVEAHRYLSTVTDRDGNWVGEAQTYRHDYSGTPVVLGQIMSYNDPNWSVFWSRGTTQNHPPDANTLYTGKHVGEDTIITRTNETIGFIVVEAGEGSLPQTGIYKAEQGDASVRGINNSAPDTYSLNNAFTEAPETGVLGQLTMDNGDGGWPYLFGNTPFSANTLRLTIDEDQIIDAERGITNADSERVGYWLFEQSTSVVTITADLAIRKLTSNPEPSAGDTITYTITFDNVGNLPMNNIVITDIVPSELSNLSVQFTVDDGVVITPTAGITYAWEILALEPRQGGTITISGQLDTQLALDERITNTVVMSTTDVDEANNNNQAMALMQIGCADDYTVTHGNSDYSAGSLQLGMQVLCPNGNITFADDTTVYLNNVLSVDKAMTIEAAPGQQVVLSGDSGNDGVRDVRIFEISPAGALTVSNISIVSGTAVSGGAIWNSGELTLQNSALIANHSTVADTSGGGGGLLNNGLATIRNSTLAYNQSENGSGGAIFNGSGGALFLIHATIADNDADLTGGLYQNGGGMSIINTLIANNTTVSQASGSDCYSASGLVLDNSNALIEQQLNCGSPKVSSDPVLSSLGYYESQTPIYALLPGSPAINAVVTNTVVEDQRGFPRNSSHDIGAFESQGFLVTVLAGNNQTAEVNTQFATPLMFQIEPLASNEPIGPGGKISFQADADPVSGAGLTTSAFTLTTTATVSQTFTQPITANDKTGVHFVFDTTKGSAFPISFMLGNFEESPGGISSGLGLWLRADVGTATTVDGGAVSSWVDQSENGWTATNLIDAIPTYHSEAINFNPAVTFGAGGVSELSFGANYVTATSSSGQTGLTIFAVTKPISDASPSPYIIDVGAEDGNGYGLAYNTNNILSYSPPQPPTFVLGNHNRGDIPALAVHQIAFGLQNKVYLDGEEIGSTSQTLTQLDNGNISHSSTHQEDSGPLTIGRAATSMVLPPGGSEFRYFEGDIAEIIIYASGMEENTSFMQVQTYLALKYGITLQGVYSYTHSGGGAVWDMPDNFAYHHDVAGIWRDDGSLHSQLKSRSVNTDSVVTMAHGNDLSNPTAIDIDRSFLVWGNDNVSLNSGQNIVANTLASRLGRTWYVQETGTMTDVSLSFDLSGLGLSWTPSEVALIIDDDADFSDATVYTTGLTIQGDVIAFNQVDFSDGAYFSLRLDQLLSDVTISKSVSPPVVDPGQTITYTLTVSNTGSYHISNIGLTDMVPNIVSNLNNEFSAPSGVTILPTLGVTYAWTMSHLEDGQSAVFTVTGQIPLSTTAGTVTNTAVVTTPSLETNTSNNDDSAGFVINNVVPTVLSASFSVTENVAIGTDVGTVTATDKNGDDLTFIISTGNSDGIFAINNSGQITIIDNTTLDYETDPQHVLTIAASDGSLTGTGTITVAVNNLDTDLILNKTVNPSSATPGETIQYTLNYTNAGGDIATSVIITDDLPISITVQSVVGTPIVPVTQTQTGLTFDLGTVEVGDTGSIVITGMITEPHPVGVFTNSAVIRTAITDTNSSNNEAVVGLSIINAAPTILPATFTVAENVTNGTMVGNVSAVDGNGDNFVLSIVAGNESGIFALNDSGQITVTNNAALDYEVTTLYTLTVAASDGLLTGTETISIAVSNVNADLVITKVVTPTAVDPGDSITYTLTFSNTGIDTAIGVVITDLIASDFVNVVYEATADSGVTVTQTAGITYAWIVGPLMQGQGGIITITGQLPETIAAGGITNTAVITTDSGDSNAGDNTSSASITVRNIAPVIKPTTFNVPENEANGTTLGGIMGTDGNGDTPDYSIIAGNDEGVFTLDAYSGNLSINNNSRLDYEMTPQFLLTIAASDESLSSTTTITVNVTDLSTNVALAKVVGSSSATPGDVITYSLFFDNYTSDWAHNVLITDTFPLSATFQSYTSSDDMLITQTVSNNLYQVFEIGSLAPGQGGIITMTAQLDMPLAVGGITNSAIITFTPADLGSEFHTDAVGVTILNVAPVVAPATFNLAEDADNGSLVGAVSALDNNGDGLTMGISAGNDNGIFAISNSGQITVADNSALDYEMNQQHVLSVTASDGLLTNTASITIAITNVNDNAPVITSATVSLAENATNGTSVVLVDASDADGDALSYTIMAGNNDNIFAIANDGQISVGDRTNLDYETTPQYVLTVAAHDSVFTSTANITVSILNLDADLALSKQVAPTSAAPGETITYTLDFTNTGGDPATGVVIADQMPSGLINLSYESSKAITATGGVDYVWLVEDLSPFEQGIITITAQLTGGLSVGTQIVNIATIATSSNEANQADHETTVELTVTNAAPTIDAVVAQNINEGETLTLTIRANDPNNDVLSYGLITPPDGATIDQNGNLTWTPAEVQGPEIYILTVIVSDSGGLTNTTNIPVTVNEVNTAPRLDPIGDQTIAETNQLAFTLAATDDDVPANALTYSLSNVPDGAVLDSNTGLFQWAPAVGQGNNVYPLTFTVSDNGTPALNDSQTMTIIVTALPTYTLTINTAGSGTGAVTVTPTYTSYVAGTVVTVTALAESDSTFDHWSGDLSGTDNPTFLTLDANKVLTATFSEKVTSDEQYLYLPVVMK
ncbi:MAG: cadherin domain-containing protein [Chloroflexota bacterium]